MTIIPNTEVRLLSNVPFNKSYEHTRYFEDKAAQTNYFLGKAQHTFLDFTYQREEKALLIPKAYDDLYLCNYVMYKNTSFGSKWFYGFITHKEYVNPNFTKVYFELDVFQTWLFEMQWKPSFVVREHRQRWNADGSPVVNTVDEGLNYGTEYDIASVENYRPCEGVYFLVVACKQGMHGSINKGYYASLNGLPQLMIHYVHPFKLDGSTPGTNLGSLSSITDFLAALYTQDNAVNNVVSIYITDCLPNNPSYSNDSLGFDSSNFEKVTLSIKLNGADVNTVFVKDMNYSSWTYVAGDKYDGYSDVTESKLLMYPYTNLELMDLRGNKVTYKNEYIKSNDLMITINASLGMNNKVVYQIKDYLTGSLNDDGIKIKVNMEHALVNNDPNEMPIFTDLLSAYLQGNRNQIKNEKQSIAFNGAMGALQSGLGAMMGGMMAGTMIAGGVQGVGNSYLQIQGIAAKQQDIMNTPPSLNKLGNDTYFDYGNKLTGVWIVKKEITAEYRKKLTDFFKMYGYKVNELKTPNLHTRQHFNFVQTVGANIVGNIPNLQIDKLKGIFDTGITLWHTDDICNYALSNGEI